MINEYDTDIIPFDSNIECSCRCCGKQLYLKIYTSYAMCSNCKVIRGL